MSTDPEEVVRAYLDAVGALDLGAPGQEISA
jgi:hypothetical protein